MTNREIIIKEEEISNYKYYCKCGHTVVIYSMENKVKKYVVGVVIGYMLIKK